MESPIWFKSICHYDGRGAGKSKTLSFPNGALIKVLAVGKRGWCKGEYKSQIGWFPIQFAHQLNKSEPSSIPPTSLRTFQQQNVMNQPKSMNRTCDNTDKQALPTCWTEYNNSKFAGHVEEVDDNLKQFSSLQSSKPYENQYGPNIKEIKSFESSNMSQEFLENNHEPQKIDKTGFDSSNVQEQADLIQAPSSSCSTFDCPSNSKFVSQSGCDLKDKHSRITSLCQDDENAVEMINGLSFPLIKTSQNQQISNTSSYSDHFWSDREDCSGFYVVYKKIIKEKELCLEMGKLLKARENLENQYAKGLARISSSLHAVELEGTLGKAWKQLKDSTKVESQFHQNFASMLRVDVRQPLEELRDYKRKEIKKINSIIGDLRVSVFDKYKRLEATANHYLELENEVTTKMENNCPDEEIFKSKAYRDAVSDELPALMSDYNKSRQHWCNEVVDSYNFFEKEEIYRSNKTVRLLDHYCSLQQAHTNGVKASTELLLQSIDKVSPVDDRGEWIKENATGSVRPVDLIL